MSRSLLVVICDFLLLSMLSMVSFEGAETKTDDVQQTAQSLEQNFVDSQLVDLLKMSLDKEREQRGELSKQVSSFSEKAEKNAELSERQKKLIAQREAELAALEKSKRELQTEMEQIVKKSKDLEAKVKLGDEKNMALQSEISGAMEKLKKTSQDRAKLQAQLSDLHKSDSTLKARLESVQGELESNKAHLEKLKDESERLKNENRAIELEKRALSARLEVASVKSQIYEQNLKKAEAMVQVEKSEKQRIQQHAEKLAEGVGELAAQNEKLAQDVKDIRPFTASEIFEEARKNAVSLTLDYTRKGLFGEIKYSDTAKAVAISANGNNWVLIGVANTLFDANSHDFIPPETMSLTVSANGFKFSAASIFRVKTHSGVMAVALPKSFIEKTKIKVYDISKQPFKFSQAVVIDAKKFYYGEFPYNVDVKDQNLAAADVGLFSAILGNFTPSSGDLVFTKGGDFLGLMASYTKVGLFRQFGTSGELLLSKRYNRQQAAQFQRTVGVKK